MSEPTRTEVDGWPGITVLEFGAGWCPICQHARPYIDRALRDAPGVRHTWVEDGRGLPLGRSFRVKLWPTLVVLRDGVEVARTVRPNDEAEVRAVLAQAGALGASPST
jgi:thioredoxin 1